MKTYPRKVSPLFYFLFFLIALGIAFYVSFFVGVNWWWNNTLSMILKWVKTHINSIWIKNLSVWKLLAKGLTRLFTSIIARLFWIILSLKKEGYNGFMKETKHFVGWEYRGEIYATESEVDEAICEFIGEHYNNVDPMDTNEFEDEFFSQVEEVWEADDVATRIINDYIENNK